jgi:hypothetical protein
LLQRLCVGPPSADKQNAYDLRWRLRHAQDQGVTVKRGVGGQRVALWLAITIALPDGQKAAGVARPPG